MLYENDHKYFMAKVLDLAISKKGFVSPNPYVACLLVSNGQVIGTGLHNGAGSSHAELDALLKLPKCFDRSKIILYVNLEPCCHFDKRTPPCAQLLIREGITNVVIGCLDPNIKVSGNGVKLLRNNNIDVTTGVLEDECKKINKIFFKNMLKGLPYFEGKIACSLDGKIALENGSSKWITSSKSRKRCHEDRVLYDAILVGKNTFFTDRPKLNSRDKDKVIKENKKIIIGNYLDIIDSIGDYNPNNIIIISQSSVQDSASIMNHNGIRILFFKDKIEEVFNQLLSIGICSVYVEGGGKTFSYFLKKKIFDEISIYKSPKILGKGKSFSDQFRVNNISESLHLKNIEYTILGEDILLKGYL